MNDLLQELDEITDPLSSLRPFMRRYNRYPATSPESACIACGYEFTSDHDATNNHWMMRFGERHPFPVCIGMNLTRNHCVYQLKCIADPEYGQPHCYCTTNRKHPQHPAERLVESYLPRAREVWGRRVEALDAELADVARELGIDWPVTS